MATNAKNKAAHVATYVVVSPLEHDLVRYEPGEKLELDAARAAPLLFHTVKPADETKAPAA